MPTTGGGDGAGADDRPRPVAMETAGRATSPSRRRLLPQQAVPEKDDSGSSRGAEKTTTTTHNAAAEIFRSIDRIGEKQQHSKNIRALIQKAAQKTILVVRTKNATQAAENVSIRYSKDQVTEPPRCVQLQEICAKVLHHMQFGSGGRRRLFRELFATAHELEAILKDMFWYLTAHCFQGGRHLPIEERYYHRIADNFTSLFIRVQIHPTSRDAGFFDALPDVLAQIMFLALYEGFPKSRKSILHPELRRQILQISYSWVLGFVPAELDWSHWAPVDHESPKRIAALAEFPAMRNRMIRAERIERTKLEVKNRHRSALDEEPDDLDDMRAPERFEVAPDAADPGGFPPGEWDKLPPVPRAASTHAGTHTETRERAAYQMQNSPLVDAFLMRHQLQGNASHLKVQLRLTTSKHFDLQNQAALHPTKLPSERRRRLMNPKAYTECLAQIENFGDTVRTTYATEKKKMREHDSAERHQLAQDQRELDAQFGELRRQSAKMHEFSNLLVSKGRIDALLPSKDGGTTGTTSISPPSNNGNNNSVAHAPRPPPHRPNPKVGSSRRYQ